MEYEDISIKDIKEMALLQILFCSPKCTLCNKLITEDDYINDNYYCTLPVKKYYKMIFAHKTCVFKNIKGGC